MYIIFSEISISTMTRKNSAQSKCLIFWILPVSCWYLPYCSVCSVHKNGKRAIVSTSNSKKNSSTWGDWGQHFCSSLWRPLWRRTSRWATNAWKFAFRVLIHYKTNYTHFSAKLKFSIIGDLFCFSNEDIFMD